MTVVLSPIFVFGIGAQADLERARQHTRLCHIPVNVILDFFGQASDDRGFLSRSVVHACFCRIRECAQTEDGSDAKRTAKSAVDDQVEKTKIAASQKTIVDHLFDAFDVDQSGEVDCRELASGLSVRCS